MDAISGGVIPKQFIPAVEAGIREALGAGIQAGYPVVDLEVKLVGGSFQGRFTKFNSRWPLPWL